MVLKLNKVNYDRSFNKLLSTEFHFRNDKKIFSEIPSYVKCFSKFYLFIFSFVIKQDIRKLLIIIAIIPFVS